MILVPFDKYRQKWIGHYIPYCKRCFTIRNWGLEYCGKCKSTLETIKKIDQGMELYDFNQGLVAEWMGVGPDTLSKMMNRIPELKKKYRKLNKFNDFSAIAGKQRSLDVIISEKYKRKALDSVCSSEFYKSSSVPVQQNIVMEVLEEFDSGSITSTTSFAEVAKKLNSIAKRLSLK